MLVCMFVCMQYVSMYAYMYVCMYVCTLTYRTMDINKYRVFRRRRGLFLRPPHVRDFVKEGYFFVPTYEVWGSESPYNPLNFKITLAENKEKSAGKIIIGTHSIKINFFSISLVMSGKL